ncbi:hypothetical protein CERZMDRAFT_121889 [Cercospora zeae-maydis SCOH1-5]|uniref:Heterokaryon incompatibility domain-containing protein n=1 Tax=Cercospora zeae-maydis SCOH1-5 TaxID=717836 RepID=A0A6A6FA40_9PEZI|nr:hypothetical protein CERZMDRAFT_121889 [Cercospora zeae-maydis SCOH1-5]
MRLLNVKSLNFAEFRDDDRPKYVIASHRWVEGSEATLRDVRNRRNTDKSGYKKITGFAKYAEKHVPAVEWLWVDTCCIDKTNAAELSESLNLMVDWYRNAVLCIVYLVDVKSTKDLASFRQSEWFKRGWTLQELLAPQLLVFVTETWQVIGNKGASTNVNCGTPAGPDLEMDIAAITSIPERVLRDYAASTDISVNEKLRWMEGRATTKPEDMSYALYGIFGVTPGANYGERHEGARRRLLAAIHHQDDVAAQKTERFQMIVEWLSSPDPWTNHQTARQLHEPLSGAWLLQSDLYQDWKNSSTRHLWMHGKPGCGKTVLCSTAIEDIKEHCQNCPNAGYAIFYFSFSETQKQQITHLLRSLIVQLGWREPAFSILKQLYNRPNRIALGLGELERTLLACFEAYDTQCADLRNGP